MLNPFFNAKKSKITYTHIKIQMNIIRIYSNISSICTVYTHDFVVVCVVIALELTPSTHQEAINLNPVQKIAMRKHRNITSLRQQVSCHAEPLLDCCLLPKLGK